MKSTDQLWRGIDTKEIVDSPVTRSEPLETLCENLALLAADRGGQKFRGWRFVRFRQHNLALRIQRPECVLEHIRRVVQTLDLTHALPVVAKGRLHALSWFVATKELCHIFLVPGPECSMERCGNRDVHWESDHRCVQASKCLRSTEKVNREEGGERGERILLANLREIRAFKLTSSAESTQRSSSISISH